MISPLCGNGMAMAIHSAKILSETIIEHHSDRAVLENVYQVKWKDKFENRLKAGRLTQRLFGSNIISLLAVKALKLAPELSKFIVKRTHGNPF